MPRGHASTGKSIIAGFLTWLIPGAGHLYLGYRGLAVVFFVAISVPYWTGLAVGGIKNCVNPWSNHWLFLAEMGTGGYTTGALLVNVSESDFKPQNLKDPKYLNTLEPDVRGRYLRYMSYYPESDVAQIYLAAAGLLNILAILDAITRAQTGGLPTFYHELPKAPEAAPGGGA